MADNRELELIKTDISSAKNFWQQRNIKMKEWYSILTLVDTLAAKGLESYVSNEPQTFYNMAHYLLTKGKLNHFIPIESESSLDLDRRGRVNRACSYMWDLVDRNRRLGGNGSFIDELGFFMLVTGWYAVALAFDNETGNLQAQVFNPADTYPIYADNRMVACVHSYEVTPREAQIKCEEKGWYAENLPTSHQITGTLTLDDYFTYKDGKLYNVVLFSGNPVTDFIEREDMRIMAAPVGGFADRGSLGAKGSNWKALAGRSIFEVNTHVVTSLNKWRTMVNQILRDTAQPITEEFSAVPQATPEQLRERGAHFHFSPGEQGIVRIPPAAIPMEIHSNLQELKRELQKGSFNDAVYGMLEGQSGYALSLLATSSANQILYPFMDAKHFVISECDNFWLSSLKASGRTFAIKGQFIEELKPNDIPEDVLVQVDSDVATPKDWLERGTIANQMSDTLDETTIISEIYKLDPQMVRRRKKLDSVMNHQMSKQIELIAGYYQHAEYLRTSGDTKQADLFEKAAQALESQLSGTTPGEGNPAEANRIAADREAGTPAGRKAINPEVAPPEATGGFTPQNLRYLIGSGTVRGKKAG